MLAIALMACLSDQPKCAIVRTFNTTEACEMAKSFLQQSPIDWAPLHCEQRRDERQT